MISDEWVEYDGGEVRERHLCAGRIRVAPGVTVIPDAAFRGCGLWAVDLSNVTAISSQAFRSCYSLERVVWTTASAVEIGESVFADCKSLSEIDIRNATKIGAGAFSDCTSLERVSISSSVAAIEASAFQRCKNLAEVELGEGIQRIGGDAFNNCNALTRINIPSSATTIGAGAFCDCSMLEEVELNEGLQCIGQKAFRHCTSLESISIPSTTLEIGVRAFIGCPQLRYVELQEGLQTIGKRAFADCHSLERVTIPSSVKLVGTGAFEGCHGLVEVTLREGFHHIGDAAFNHCPVFEQRGHINIPPVAFVIDLVPRRCCLMRTASMDTPLLDRLVVSKWMRYRSPHQLEQAEAKVNEILGRRPQTEVQRIQLIREWFAYLDLLDVTTMLELAIWRVNIDGNENDTAARQASRRHCEPYVLRTRETVDNKSP